MAIVRFADAKDAILLRLYFMAMKDIGIGGIWEPQLARMKPDGVSEVIANKAIESLRAEGFAQIHRDDESDQYWYDITSLGLNYIDDRIERHEGYVFEVYDDTLAWSERVFGLASSPVEAVAVNLTRTNEAPASDRLVRLDDNQQAFAEFLTSLSDLIEALSSDEQSSNLSDDDRLFLRGQLDAALRMTQASPVVTFAGLTTVLLPPIQYIAERVTAGIIGAKAAAILDFLLTFLN